MPLTAMRKKRIALIITLVLGIFSTGAAIVHQCDVIKDPTPFASKHNHEQPNSPSAFQIVDLKGNFGFAENLMDGACGALFIVVMLLGRKYLFLNRRQSTTYFSKSFSANRFTNKTSQVFTFTLSQPELGIFRI